jgi:hypothetical protein
MYITPLFKSGHRHMYLFLYVYIYLYTGSYAQSLLEWLLKIIKHPSVEEFLKKNDSRAVKIYTTIGIFMYKYIYIYIYMYHLYIGTCICKHKQIHPLRI